MTQTVEEAVSQAALYSDDYLYRLVKLPPGAITAAAGVVAEAGNPFTALIVDKDEVSLMLEDEDFHQYKKRLLSHTVSEIVYRLITFDVELDPLLVGFMARVSRALADAGISLVAYGAFSRDHIFVPAADFEQAITVLEQLKGT